MPFRAEKQDCVLSLILLPPHLDTKEGTPGPESLSRLAGMPVSMPMRNIYKNRRRIHPAVKTKPLPTMASVSGSGTPGGGGAPPNPSRYT